LPAIMVALVAVIAYFPIGRALEDSESLEFMANALGVMLVLIAVVSGVLFAGTMNALSARRWQPLILAVLFGFGVGLGFMPGLYVGASIRSRASRRQRPIEIRIESGVAARRVVEGRLQRALEMAAHAVLPGLFRVEAGGLREMMEPAHAGGDMADLVAIDAIENNGAGFIAGVAELGDGRGCHVEAARLQHQGHNGEASEQVVGGFLRCLP
jgi:hypothetical protein